MGETKVLGQPLLISATRNEKKTKRIPRVDRLRLFLAVT
jgi:hypothetical protein